MQLIKTARILTNYLSNLREQDKNVTIGFVPTMGALHEGHLSLIEQSTINNDITVCSIFVNPTQFGEKKDLETYPKPIENDIELLVKNNCDILFLPDYEEVFPAEYKQQVFELDGLDFKIEGASRPGHFQGVCNVLYRFFEIIAPNNAYFGQKDFQQTVVVKKLVELVPFDIDIVVVPIMREPHRLAMSSRNVRLSKQGRQNAAFINKALRNLKENVDSMSVDAAIEKAKQFINAQKGASIDYLMVVDVNTLEQVEDMSKPSVALTVVEYEGVRLLDNIILN